MRLIANANLPFRPGSVLGILWLTGILSGSLSAQPSIRFAVIGDYGQAGQAELDVSNLVAGWNPDVVITTGDNNYQYGADSTIDRNIGQYYHQFIFPYTGSYGPGDTVNRFFPSLGNHDWLTAGAAPYLAYFTLPGNERYYDFGRGPVHFFSIDSDGNEPDGNSGTSVQAQWLEAKLGAAVEPWKVVYFHHPPYSSGTRHGSSLVMRWPFRQWGASIVLAGHEHSYERLIEDSIFYFVNGSGGKSLYGFGTPLPGSLVRDGTHYGAMLVDADSQAMVIKFVARSGATVDSLFLTHGNVSVLGVKTGWNMVSVPAISPDPRTATLFPGAVSAAFVYNGSAYEQRDSLFPGLGYWMKFSKPASVVILGGLVRADTIDVVEGWNLIGTVSHPTVPADIVQVPGGIVVSSFFGYSGGYFEADTLFPGEGYWVKVNQAGQLFIPD